MFRKRSIGTWYVCLAQELMEGLGDLGIHV